MCWRTDRTVGGHGSDFLAGGGRWPAGHFGTGSRPDRMGGAILPDGDGIVAGSPNALSVGGRIGTVRPVRPPEGVLVGRGVLIWRSEMFTSK